MKYPLAYIQGPPGTGQDEYDLKHDRDGIF